MKIFQGENGLYGVEHDGSVYADAMFQKGTAIAMAEFGEQMWQFGVAIESETTDPRANLRRCIDKESNREAFFHGRYTDVNSDECALLEYQNGETGEAYWNKIRFIDVPTAAE